MPLTSYLIGFGDGARGQHREDCIHGPGSKEAYLDEGNSSGWKSIKKRDAGVVERHAGLERDAGYWQATGLAWTTVLEASMGKMVYTGKFLDASQQVCGETDRFSDTSVKCKGPSVQGSNWASDDDDCFYYHSWRNNVVIAFGTLSSFLT